VAVIIAVGLIWTDFWGAGRHLEQIAFGFEMLWVHFLLKILCIRSLIFRGLHKVIPTFISTFFPVLLLLHILAYEISLISGLHFLCSFLRYNILRIMRFSLLTHLLFTFVMLKKSSVAWVIKSLLSLFLFVEKHMIIWRLNPNKIIFIHYNFNIFWGGLFDFLKLA